MSFFLNSIKQLSPFHTRKRTGRSMSVGEGRERGEGVKLRQINYKREGNSNIVLSLGHSPLAFSYFPSSLTARRTNIPLHDNQKAAMTHEYVFVDVLQTDDVWVSTCPPVEVNFTSGLGNVPEDLHGRHNIVKNGRVRKTFPSPLPPPPPPPPPPFSRSHAKTINCTPKARPLCLTLSALLSLVAL